MTELYTELDGNENTHTRPVPHLLGTLKQTCFLSQVDIIYIYLRECCSEPGKLTLSTISEVTFS